MDIRQFNERVSIESQILQNVNKQRELLTGERLRKLEGVISKQHAILAAVVAERKDFRVQSQPCVLATIYANSTSNGALHPASIRTFLSC